MNTNYIKIPKIVLQLLFFSFFGLLFSCKKIDLDKISQSGTWNPNLAFPLGYGEFTVYDILARTDSSDIVVIDEDSRAIALVYTGDFFTIFAEDLLQLSNFSETYAIDLADFGATPVPSFNGQLNYQMMENIEVDFDNDARINEIDFESGDIVIQTNSTFSHSINLSLTLPSFVSGGNPLELNVTIPASSGNTSTISLADVSADFTLNNTSFNVFPIEAEFVLNGNGSPIQGNETANVNISFSNLSFDLATGYIGNQSFNIVDSILIRIFDEVRDGFFQFTDPKVYLEITNSFGIPMEIEFNELKTIVTQTGEALQLTGYPNPLEILAPGTVGSQAVTLILLDKSNTSNIESIVTPTPKYFYYDGSLNLNPNGLPQQPNFISKNSQLGVYGEIELPLEGFAYGFTMRDTFEFNTGYDFSDTEQIDYVMFRLFIDNGFPADVDGQVVFMDENYNVLFTAFDDLEDVAVSASVDANGVVVSSTKKITDIVLDKTKIDLLEQVKFYQLIGNGKTLDGPQERVVKFFDYYKTFLKLSIQVEARQNF